MGYVDSNVVRIALAIAAGTVTVQDCMNERLGVAYTAISDECGLIEVHLTNEAAQQAIQNAMRELCPVETLATYQHK